MWRIHSLLHAPDLAFITESAGSGVALLSGLAGTGKSLLAEEYALRFAAAYPGGVFWLRAPGYDKNPSETEQGARETERRHQIRAFAKEFGLSVSASTPAEIEGVLAREIEKRGLPCLWVADDVPPGLDPQGVRRFFAPRPLAKTLITTRSREYSSFAPQIQLGDLAESEAYDLLVRHCRPRGNSEEADARELVRDLGYHAMAVDVAGAALAHSEGLKTIGKYRAEMRRSDSDVTELAAELAGVLPNGHESSISKILLRSIHTVGAEAWDFLQLAAALAQAPIPPLIVAWTFQLAYGLNEREAERRTLLALRSTDSHSLTEKPTDQDGARTVHRLVTRTVRFEQSRRRSGEDLRAAAVCALYLKLGRVVDDPRKIRRIHLYFTHARELSSKRVLLTRHT